MWYLCETNHLVVRYFTRGSNFPIVMQFFRTRTVTNIVLRLIIWFKCSKFLKKSSRRKDFSGRQTIQEGRQSKTAPFVLLHLWHNIYFWDIHQFESSSFNFWAVELSFYKWFTLFWEQNVMAIGTLWQKIFLKILSSNCWFHLFWW